MSKKFKFVDSKKKLVLNLSHTANMLGCLTNHANSFNIPNTMTEPKTVITEYGFAFNWSNKDEITAVIVGYGGLATLCTEDETTSFNRVSDGLGGLKFNWEIPQLQKFDDGTPKIFKGLAEHINRMYCAAARLSCLARDINCYEGQFFKGTFSTDLGIALVQPAKDDDYLKVFDGTGRFFTLDEKLDDWIEDTSHLKTRLNDAWNQDVLVTNSHYLKTSDISILTETFLTGESK